MNHEISERVTQAFLQLGRDISLARRRRGLTQAQLGRALNCSEMTIRRLEKGHSQVPAQILFNAYALFGKETAFLALLSPSEDTEGIRLQETHIPLRVRKSNPNFPLQYDPP